MANKVNVELSLQTTGYVQGMDQATDSTKKYSTETKKIKDSVESFRKEFSKTKKETLDLALAYSKLSKEAKASQFGKEMARQLQEATEKQAQLKDMLEDTNRAVKNMASDTRALDTLAEGMNVIANATSLYMGVLAQLTGDEKTAKEAVVMFTTAQSALNTVTAIANALQDESNIMLGINAIKNGAATMAENMRTAAVGKGVVATKAATAAQKAFNVVASANPYVILATAALAVGTALYAFASASSKAKEEQERANKAAEEAKKKAEQEAQARQQAGQSYIDSAEKLRTLKAAYEASNNQLEKTEIIKEASAEFKKLGINVKGTNDAQKILVENGDKLIEMLRLQADAAAIDALRMDMLKKKMQEIMESSGANISEAYGRATYMLKSQLADADKKANEVRSKARKLQQELKTSGVNFDDNTKSGKSTKIKVDYEVGSLADLQAQLSKLQDKLKKKNLTLVDRENTLKEIERLKSEIEKKEIELKIKEPDPKKVVGSAAWYDEQINELEKKKALLPLDAYIERDKLQKQIDNLHLKVKLETEGVQISGKLDVSKALTGTYDKTIKGISDAISTLESKLQGDVGENGQLLNTEQVERYTAKIIELKQELYGMQKAYDESLLTPMEKAQKHFDEVTEKAEKSAEAWASFSNIAGSLGSAFKTAGNEAAAAMMEVVSATLNGVSQIIPQIMKLIAAKQAEAMAEGTASAAKLPFPASLGAIASIVATVLSTFASIYSVIKGAEGHANGGVVGGHSYTGDKILARLNSGELVLNQRQQNKVLDKLDSQKLMAVTTNKVEVVGKIRGTDILLVSKNTNRVLGMSGNSINI